MAQQVASVSSLPPLVPSQDDVHIGVDEPLQFDPLKRLSPDEQLKEHSWLAYVVLCVSVFLEVVTATFNVLFILFSASSNVPYIEFVVTGYPRIVLFLLCSYLMNKRKWWQQYLKVDHPFGGYVTSCIAYAFLIYGSHTPSDPGTAFQGWRLHAAILFPFVYFALVGNLRVMCKWFPWTRRTMYLYKMVRIYHLIFFTFNQVLGQFTHSVLESGTVAYFGTMLYLLRELLGHVVRREAALMPLFREQRARYQQQEREQHRLEEERRRLEAERHRLEAERRRAAADSAPLSQAMTSPVGATEDQPLLRPASKRQ